MFSKERIIQFGIPAIEELSNRKLEFLFSNDKVPPRHPKEFKYHCCDHDVKFSLYDIENKIHIFTMDFYEPDKKLLPMNREPRHLLLELIYVDKHFRKKGIARYYIERLKEYAKELNYPYIRVHPEPNAIVFNGDEGINKKELESFYKSCSDNIMEIKVGYH